MDPLPELFKEYVKELPEHHTIGRNRLKPFLEELARAEVFKFPFDKTQGDIDFYLPDICFQYVWKSRQNGHVLDIPWEVTAIDDSKSHNIARYLEDRLILASFTNLPALAVGRVDIEITDKYEVHTECLHYSFDGQGFHKAGTEIFERAAKKFVEQVAAMDHVYHRIRS